MEVKKRAALLVLKLSLGRIFHLDRYILPHFRVTKKGFP
jgi:hypothetical protein